MAARLDQLARPDRALIRDVSVLGATVDLGLAALVLDRADLAKPATWEAALGDLVIVDDQEVRFRHDLVRVAAYEGLSIRRRRAVHTHAGDVIESLFCVSSDMWMLRCIIERPRNTSSWSSP